MMKLTTNNIQFVKRMEKDGITYNWFVSMKSNRVSDSRNYINYENGKTCIKEFPMEWLPKSVQKFIENSEIEVFSEEDARGFAQYIYRA